MKNNIYNISGKELIERLRLKDNKLVNTLYETCFELLFKDNERTTSIDSKANNLLGILAVYLTIIISIVGLISDKIGVYKVPIFGFPRPWLVSFYFLMVAFSFVSIIFISKASIVRSDWRWVKDSDLFHKEMLKKDITSYKRYIITHVWEIYKNNYIINERKGVLLRWAQIWFVISLVMLLPIVVIIGLYVLQS